MSILLERTLRRAVVAVSAAALALGLTAAPAAAHSLGSAVTSSAGCGWDSDYTILQGRDITTSDGDRIGRVYLLWNGSGTKSGHNCVVTRKLGSAHGTAGYTAAALAIEDRPSPGSDYGDYSHYAAVSAWASGHCVSYRGWVEDPETGVTFSGGNDDWNYCT